jgi:hypothetical protein
MAVLAGGIGAFILGIIGLVIWWNQFLTLLAGAVPAILILGGGLAAYLGYDELKEKKREEAPKPETSELKEKIESLEKELKELKEKREKQEQAEAPKE